MLNEAESIAIEVIGQPACGHRGTTTWREVKRALHGGPQAPAGAGQPGRAEIIRGFLAEEHHRAYGRPWVLGRANVDFVKSIGVGPADRVLDFGCGAGRHGVHLVPYLEDGRYCGVDAHYLSLVAFSTYECFMHGLRPKRPRLLWDADFRFDHFGERFDVVLDAYVSFHIPRSAQRRLAEAFAGALADDGRLLICPPDHVDAGLFRSVGLVPVARHASDCAWLRSTPWRPRTDWVEFRRSPAPR